MQPSVEHLGHQIDSEGLHATDSKLQAIDAPSPKNVHELRPFLGMLNYGKFVPNLNLFSTLLMNCCTKAVRGRGLRNAMKVLRHKLIPPNVLHIVHYDPSLPIKLAADA